jgi:hypothetical protein
MENLNTFTVVGSVLCVVVNGMAVPGRQNVPGSPWHPVFFVS